MAKTKIHVGLEIGTSKTCLVVGEVRPDTAVKILGIGSTRSVGVRKGEIYDYSLAATCVKDALAQAEDASEVEIGSVFLSVTGAHFQGLNHCGTYRIPEGEETVTLEHIEEARNIARNPPIPEGNVQIHPILRRYMLDGLEQPSPPIGLYGTTVEADFHIVHGIANRIHNSMKLVREMPLEIDDVVFAPIATAQMALDRTHRGQGALVIDIGAGTTDYALYLEGAIIASGCIPVGGEHVTNDIHLVTGLPYSKAEKLKVMEGNASPDPAQSIGKARLVDENGFAEIEVNRSILNEVIRQRLEETLRLVCARLPDGAIKKLGSGVFLTGGTSQMRGFDSLAAEIFGRSIFRPETSEFSGSQTSTRDPQFSTAIGLIRYAQIMEAEKNPPPNVLRRLVGSFWPFSS